MIRFGKPAAVALGFAAAVVAALLFRASEPGGKPTPPTPVMERAHVPVAPVPETVDVPEPVADDVAAATGTALCAGCLDKQGVLDVAEGFLFYVLPNHLGLRAVPYSVEYPPDFPPEDLGLRPLLPPGLVDAPPHFSFGGGVPAPPDEKEAWIVWVHTGWVPYSRVEQHIERGDLPEVARSWPPVKEEREIVVNARTGEITSILGMSGRIRMVDPDGTNLFLPGLEEARRRAAAWFAANRPVP